MRSSMLRVLRLVALVVLWVPLAAVAPLQAQDLVIQRWLVHGPLPAPEDDGRVERDYLSGEAEVLPDPGEDAWIEAETDAFGRLDLNEVFSGQATEWSAAYAHTYIQSPDDRTVLLIADSDDDLVVRVNGQRVWVHEVARGLGRGSDTVTVRLAVGWNSLLLKPLNRGGGFGLLGRLAPADRAGLDGLRLTLQRPAGLVRHNRPRPTITVGPFLLDAGLVWRGEELAGHLTASVAAWGGDEFQAVEMALVQGGDELARRHFPRLARGEPATLHIDLRFEALRRAALDEVPIVTSVHWRGGSSSGPVFVDPDRLLRALGDRIEIAPLALEPTAAAPERLVASLAVPTALAGRSLDLLANGLGPNASYRLNGEGREWDDGRVALCSPCRSGEVMELEIVRDPARPYWMPPEVRAREIGYAEYADGYRYAEALTGRTPAIARPEAAAWLRTVGVPGERAALARRYRQAFAPLAEEIRVDTLHLIGNSHIDAAWLWPWSETIDVIRDTWRTSLKLSHLFPGYVFSASSAAFYDAMDRHEPGLADSLRAAVADGRWAPVGGWWVESDLNLPAGESLVRQGLYGQRYFEQTFGRRSRVAWTPDCFGYPWTLPQILKGQGFDFFVTQKMRWNDSTEFPYNAFQWEGLDGTRILTYNPYGYVHDLDPGRLVTERLEDRERSGTHHQLVLYGVGDHGGGPTIAMLERAEDLRRVPTFPAMVYDEPAGALRDVERSAPAAGYPVWRDEMYLEYHRGTYTTQARTKWRNRRSEAMLQIAEALAAVGDAPYPRARLEDAWRLVLFNQFHDILPGSSIPEVYEDAEVFYDSAWAIIDSITSASFRELRGRMDTRGGGRSVVVFNPLGWARDGHIALPTGDGRVVRVSVTEVPALGARVVRLPKDTMSATEERLPAPRAGRDWIENAYLRVELDTLTGAITRLLDKVNDREALAPSGRANVLQIFDDRPGQWDAWNIVLWGDHWEVTDVSRAGGWASPREARYVVERRWGNSTFRQTLVLVRDSRYLDVRNVVDWHEHRKLLKVAFELSVAADSATYEIPYGVMGRTGRPRTQAERAKFEVPGQRWADVSADGYGVSVLNDSKYGWDYRDNVLRLSLLRSPVWPDSLADRGRHEFRFAVYPHAGDWRAAGTARRAAEYNVPLLADYEPTHPGSLGSLVNFASVRPGNVELAWVKRAEEGDAWVLRLVERHGQASEAVVTMACRVARAWHANLLEDREESAETGGKTVMLRLRPYEIATLLVECGR